MSLRHFFELCFFLSECTHNLYGQTSISRCCVCACIYMHCGWFPSVWLLLDFLSWLVLILLHLSKKKKWIQPSNVTIFGNRKEKMRKSTESHRQHLNWWCKFIHAYDINTLWPQYVLHTLCTVLMLYKCENKNKCNVKTHSRTRTKTKKQRSNLRSYTHTHNCFMNQTKCAGRFYRFFSPEYLRMPTTSRTNTCNI